MSGPRPSFEQREVLRREDPEHRLLVGLVVEVAHAVVLQVLADRQVLPHLDPEGRDVRGRPDAREQEEHRRLVRARRQDHLAPGADLLDPVAARDLHADRARAVEQEAQRHRVGDHVEIRAVLRRVQEGGRRRMAEPVALRALEAADAVLACAVEVGVVVEARELARLEHRVDHGRHRAAVGHAQRPADAVERILAAVVVLGALEVGQDLVVAPALGAAGRPAVVVGAVAAQVDHGVHRARPAEHLAARQVEPPPAEARLGLAVEIPVDGGLQQHREGRGNGDLGTVVLTAGLEHRDLDARVLAQARREDAAGRSCAHDHVVVHRVSFRVSGCLMVRRRLRRDQHRAHGPDDLVGARQIGVLERRAERDRGERRAHARDRRVQEVEGRGAHLGGDLGAEAAVLDGLVRDHEAARALDGRDDRVQVERDERARVDHLGLDAVLGREAIGGRERVVHQPRERDDRDVAALAQRHGAADRHGRGRLGDVARAEVERLVLDEDDGVGIGDRAREQSRGVARPARHHDLQARHVGEPALEALRVLRAAAVARPALRAQHERHRQLPAGHEVRLGRAVDELVERERDEVDEHDLQHGPQARLRGADRHARDGRLADRRVDHARRAELLDQAGGGRVGPALGDVLAEHEDAAVGSHGGGERTGDRLDVGRLSHRRRPSASISPAAGNGLSRPKRTAASTAAAASDSMAAGASSANQPCATPCRCSRRIGSRCCQSSAAIASRYLPGSPS